MARIFQHEDVNFLVTNRVPRRYATLFMGWFSQIESRALTRLSIAVWQLFGGDLGLDEAKRSEFVSLQECFTRELRDGVRPIDRDPDVLVSPCDAVVGAHGRVEAGSLFQAKGFPYTLRDLFGDTELAARYRDATFVTLRLKSNMYHRFHAPADATVERVRYLSGDTWNVNPIALQRVERLFCKNERAVLELGSGEPEEALALVAVASILVASIRIHCTGEVFDLRYRGRGMVNCGGVQVAKGDELGFFQSGSTIVMFAAGAFAFEPGVNDGTAIQVGRALLRRTHSPRKTERRA